jgi:predicted flavoprotein YhiN
LKIVVIGGGAAGFFAAIQAASANKNAEVVLLEKTSKLLRKVRVSGVEGVMLPMLVQT